jgi:hypothetical protein
LSKTKENPGCCGIPGVKMAQKSSKTMTSGEFPDHFSKGIKLIKHVFPGVPPHEIPDNVE